MMDLPSLAAKARELSEKASKLPWNQTQNIKWGVALWSADGQILFRAEHGIDASRVSPESPVPRWQHDCDFVRLATEHFCEVIALAQQQAERIEELESQVGNLALHVLRLARTLPQDHTLRGQVLGYLSRQGLMPSPLRTDDTQRSDHESPLPRN